MKYNENNLKQLFQNEENIWDEEDLDWLDSKRVNKLQNNELPENEKQIIIEMMANDQAVMNRYLELKQHTQPMSESFIDQIWVTLKFNKLIPLLATGLALVVTLVVILNQPNEEPNFSQEVVRGVSKVSFFPAQNSVISNAPEYFIVDNHKSENVRVNLSTNNQVIWSSEFQKSHKFYLPIKIQQKMNKGQYFWDVTDINDLTIAKNSFTLN